MTDLELLQTVFEREKILTKTPNAVMYKKCEEKEKKIFKGFDCKGVHAQCTLAKKTRTFPGLLSSEYNNQGVSFRSWYLFLLLLFFHSCQCYITH